MSLNQQTVMISMTDVIIFKLLKSNSPTSFKNKAKTKKAHLSLSIYIFIISSLIYLFLHLCFSVKPKKKSFNTPEEKKKFIQDYTKKIKTEICKNWHTTGYCKFGDKVI